MKTIQFKVTGFFTALLLLIIIGTIPYAGFAQSILPAHTIKIKNDAISFSANANDWLQAAQQKYLVKGRLQILAHFNKMPGKDDRTVLNAYGIYLQDYIDDRTFTAIIDLGKTGKEIPGIVYGITDLKPVWKIEESLLKQNNDKSGRVNIIVTCYDKLTDAALKQLVMALDGSVAASDLELLHIYKISLPAANLMLLANNYGVQYITAAHDPVPLNFESRTASKANLASLATVYGGYGLDGSGITVGVGDNVSGNYHIDLKDRIINYNPNAYTDHGVHINGIVGGAGLIDPKGQGVAPMATLVDHAFDGIWIRTATYLAQHNMTLTNNSYAAVIRDCDYAGTYDALSIAIDKMTLQYPEVLHVFAAGNDGDMNCTPYPDGFATVSGGYQPAKNNIVVTSTDKYYVNAPSGSRGPVKDGRLKPEITAVGVDVNSTTHTEEYLVAGGTSMATPGVTGGLALLTQRYRQLNAGANVRADLLKNILLNGTTDIGNPGPDYRFGYGFMNVYRSLQIIDNKRYAINSVSNDAQQSFTITVPANTAQVKVMLCYNDAAASPLAAKTLINDLDVTVTTPAGITHLPLTLDPSAILANATEKEDRLNNTEQVTINNPAAGDYTITVKGFNIPSGIQDYVVSYDFVPVGVKLTYPTTGAAVNATDSLRIYWDASDNSNALTLEFSTDGGSLWNTIAANIPDSQRQYRWPVPAGISSGNCKMRLTRNNTGQQDVTGAFAITPQQQVTLDAVQCPGYIRINWNAVPNASAYEVMMKRGPKMQVMATVAATTYTFNGLSLDSTYYMAVRPLINGISGYRSLAVKRKPDDGTCTGSISDGDLMIQQVLKPVSGRKFTSTELKTTDTLSLLVRNLDDVPVDSYKVSYSVNAGALQTRVLSAGIPANGTAVATITGLDLSAIGSYKIDVAVENLSAADPVTSNNNSSKTVKQLNNQPLSLATAYLDDFESWGIVEANRDSIGISPDDHWDYENESDTCRIRSFITPLITIAGNRSISMDAIYSATTKHGNQLKGTFNLSNYNIAADEVRMEFDYILHGRPRVIQNNYVAVRGTDAQEWQRLFNFRSNDGGTGKSFNSGSLSVTDALQKNSQPFSSSMQVDFLQNDISLISERNLGTGYTIDNVRLYTVQNDIQLLAVVAPAIIECGLTGTVPLVVQLRNGVNQTLNNVQLYYQYDGGAVINEVLSSIAGKQTVNYTFNNKLDVSKNGGHTLNIWVAAAGDSYLLNDSISNYTFHNQPLITSYPYLEDFEHGDGNWYTEGLNDTWAYGTPASPKIHTAGSGTKAWKTNLTGNYNTLEASYLYSPCFDVSSLTYPAYRCKLAYDIEDCGTVSCDAARMQYSNDGLTWLRLEDSTGGSNWYSDTLYKTWTGEHTNWHSASVKLPKGLHTVRFRYLMTSDEGVNKEGIAVDDIEVFDDIPVPAIDNLLTISPNPTRDGNIVLEWSAKGGSPFDMVLYNAVGKEVYRYNTVSNQGYNKIALATPHFSSGVYLMRIIIGDKKFSRKIVYL